jgi:hypothetical protein
MPIDPQLIPHLSDALGAGFETVLQSISMERPSGGTVSELLAGKPKRRSKRRKSMSGGASRKKYTKFEFDPVKQKLSFRKTRSRPRSRSRSLTGGGEIEGGALSGWIRHVKAFAKAHKISYKAALSKASASWRAMCK